MIGVMRNKRTKKSSTVAVCDLCETQCKESEIAGGTLEISDQAVKKALDAGWTQKMVLDDKPRSRKMSWAVQLLCPKCQKSEETQ